MHNVIESVSESQSIWLLIKQYQNLQNVIRVITKLPNSEQSYKGKVKTHVTAFHPMNIFKLNHYVIKQNPDAKAVHRMSKIRERMNTNLKK